MFSCCRGSSQDKSSGDGGGVHALSCGVGALALAVGVFASVVSLLLFRSALSRLSRQTSVMEV
jgi:hypothetical protein